MRAAGVALGIASLLAAAGLYLFLGFYEYYGEEVKAACFWIPIVISLCLAAYFFVAAAIGKFPPRGRADIKITRADSEGMSPEARRSTLPVSQATGVVCTDDALLVSLADGRTLSVPLNWFPRLAAATPSQRAEFKLIGGGQGIHWPSLDEDISVTGLLRGEAVPWFTASAIK